MKYLKNSLSVFFLLLLCSNTVGAQEKLTIDQAIIGREMYPDNVSLVWRGNDLIEMKSGQWLWHKQKSESPELIMDLDKLNSLLKQAGFEGLDRLPKPDFTDKGLIRIQSRTSVILLDANHPEASQKIDLPENGHDMSFSTGYQYIAFTKGNNIFLSDINGKVIQITHSTQPGIVNGQAVSRSEFGISGGLFWSNSGRYLAFYKKDESKVSEYPLVHINTRVASTERIRYPMAGMDSEKVWVGIYDTQTGETVYIDDNSFGADQYLTNLTWDPADKYIYLAVLNRGQDHMKLKSYLAASGQYEKTLFEEQSDTYVEPLRGMFFLPDHPDQFVWFSERDGFDHLYLYASDGELIKQLTKGEFVVTEILGWGKNDRDLYYMSTEESPLERHAYKLNMRNGKKLNLTLESGTHLIKFNKDRSEFIDKFSNLEDSNIVLIKDSKGKDSWKFFESENPLKDYSLGKYVPFSTKAGDEETILHGFYILPPDFDPEKKYPLIVYVYGGPHAQLVHNKWLGGARGWQYFMAQEGFIAMTIDNRGSDGRGRDFEHVIHRHLGNAELEDQLIAVDFMKSLGFVDENRIGVHGWSYGGFMTTSLMLKYPDVFKAGVAGGPVIDWKYYEVMYGERYMDTPQENPEGYAESNLVNYVKNLKGRLMLIHGTVDPTVVWQNSLSFIDACVENQILIDYMVYPEHPHNVRGKDRVHLMKTVTRYFLDNL